MSVFWYTTDLVGLKLLSETTSIFQATFVRSVLGLLIFGTASYFETGQIFGSFEDMPFITIRSLFTSIAFFADVFGNNLLPISEASLIKNSYPALLTLLIWIFRMETPQMLTWLGVFGTVCADILIAQPPFLFGETGQVWDLKRISGYVVCVINMFAVCFSLLLVRKINLNVSPVVIGNQTLLQVGLVSIPFLIVEYPVKINWNPTDTDIFLYLLVLGGCLTQIFLVRAFQIGPPIRAALLRFTRLLTMSLAGVIVFGETMNSLQIVGACLAIASVGYIIWVQQRKRQENQSLSKVSDTDSEIQLD